MGCMLFWVKFGNAFAYFVVSCLLARWRFYSIYLNGVYLIARSNCALAGKESFYLHGIFNDITEQDTSLLDCKHKHMMKSGAPPDKVGVLHCLLPIEFHGFTSNIDF